MVSSSTAPQSSSHSRDFHATTSSHLNFWSLIFSVSTVDPSSQLHGLYIRGTNFVVTFLACILSLESYLCIYMILRQAKYPDFEVQLVPARANGHWVGTWQPAGEEHGVVGDPPPSHVTLVLVNSPVPYHFRATSVLLRLATDILPGLSYFGLGDLSFCGWPAWFPYCCYQQLSFLYYPTCTRRALFYVQFSQARWSMKGQIWVSVFEKEPWVLFLVFPLD